MKTLFLAWLAIGILCGCSVPTGPDGVGGMGGAGGATALSSGSGGCALGDPCEVSGAPGQCTTAGTCGPHACTYFHDCPLRVCLVATCDTSAQTCSYVRKPEGNECWVLGHRGACTAGECRLAP